MAVFQKSALVEGISGKVGGIVFTSNASGGAIRAKVTPRNPKTARQTAARAALAAAGAAWAALSGAQRDAWSAYAQETPITGRLGRSVTLSGYDMYCRQYALSVFAASTPATNAPSTSGLAAAPAFTSVAQTAASASMSFVFPSGAWWKSITGTSVIARVSRAQSPTRRTLQSPMRSVVVCKGSSTSPPSSPVAVTNPWGTVASGQVVYVEIEVLDVDGQLSTTQSFVVTAA